MSRGLSRLSGGVVATGVMFGVASLLAAGTASAATVAYATGPAAVSYSCNFPTIGQRQLDVTASFNAPDSVPAGTAITPTDVAGTATISASIHALLNAASYDGVRGKANVPVNVTNATPATGTASNVNVPEQIYPYVAGPLTFTIAQDSGTTVPTFSGVAAGPATASLGSTITAPLEFHKKNGTWTAWNFTCTLLTSPAQNTAFSPSITIT